MYSSLCDQLPLSPDQGMNSNRVQGEGIGMVGLAPKAVHRSEFEEVNASLFCR